MNPINNYLPHSTPLSNREREERVSKCASSIPSLEDQKRPQKRTLSMRGIEETHERKRSYRPYSPSSPIEEEIHQLPLKEPYLHQIQDGRKLVEGRVATKMYLQYREGDIIEFFNHSSRVTCRIKRITLYHSFQELLEREGFERVLPGIRSIEDGVRIYNNLPNYREKAERYGVLAFRIERL